MSLIQTNFAQIANTVAQLSPEPAKVKILGVTKFQSLEKIREALDAGLSCLGVNYVQEGEKQRQAIHSAGIQWHFIGHIQSRKAKLLLPYDCIESLDRLDIAEDLDRRAGAISKTLSVLVEINIGQETQKSGILPEDLSSFMKNLKSYKHLQISGFMAMPPALSPEERRPFFKEMKILFDRYSTDFSLEILSMGTSEDYPIALQEGANLIRLGTALFGPRQH